MSDYKRWLLLLTCTVPTVAAAAELDASVSADFFDKYIWRGQMLGHAGVVQPSVTLGKAGASVNVWGNMPMNTGDPLGKPWAFNELDYTLDYSGEAGVLGYSGGLILYTFPRPVVNQPQPNSTQELYAALSADVLLAPSVTIYKDIKQNGGWYLNAGVGHSLPLGESLALDLGASLGWGDTKYNKAYWAAGTGANLNDLALSVSLPLAAGPVSVVPSLSYVTLVESKVRGNNGYSGNSDFLFAGIGLSAEF